MARFGFNSYGSYQSMSPIVDAEDMINFFLEAVESQQGKTAFAMYGSPGLKSFANLTGETAVFGMKWVPSQGRLFAAGSHLYEIKQTGAVTDLGALVPPSGPITFAVNSTQMLICSAGQLWVFTFATNGLAAVVSPPFSGAGVGTIGFSDGFAVAVQFSPADIALSALGDFSSWNALNTSSISLFPDNIVSMVVDHRELTLFGNTKTVVYSNAGAAIFPFQPVPGAFSEYGADSAFGQVQLDNSVFWTSFDERGNLVAYRSSGYNGVRVSNHAIEQQWQTYSKTSDLISYSVQMNGHPWWHLYFPTANVSWRYDVATGMWHKALGWENGAWTAHHSRNHVFAFGKHLVGDWETGNIYQMAFPVYNSGSWSFCDDAGATLRRLRRAPYVQIEGQRVYHNRIQFDLESGLGPIPALVDGNGNPRAPQIMLRWSDTATKTWSNEHLLDCWKAGEYRKRIFKSRLGSTYFGRVYEMVVSDPVPWNFADVYLDADPSYKPAQRLVDRIKAIA